MSKWRYAFSGIAALYLLSIAIDLLTGIGKYHPASTGTWLDAIVVLFILSSVHIAIEAVKDFFKDDE